MRWRRRLRGVAHRDEIVAAFLTQMEDA